PEHNKKNHEFEEFQHVFLPAESYGALLALANVHINATSQQSFEVLAKSSEQAIELLLFVRAETSQYGGDLSAVNCEDFLHELPAFGRKRHVFGSVVGG